MVYLSLYAIFAAICLCSGAPLEYGRAIPIHIFRGYSGTTKSEGASKSVLVEQTPEVVAIGVTNPPLPPLLGDVVRSVKPIKYLSDTHADVTVYIQELPALSN